MIIMSSGDYYSVLGLPRNATDLEINRAYRNLSLLWHPTKNLSSRAEADSKFQMISEAFQVLSNDHLRRMYDRHGKDGLIEDSLVELNFNGFLPRSTGFLFRDPMDVFLEFFGGRDPVLNQSAGRGGRPLSMYDEHCFENSFPGFPRSKAIDSKNITNGRYSASTEPSFFSGSMFSSPTDDGGFVSVCKTKRILNGKHIVTVRDVLNDDETITIEEDGNLISKTINGIAQPP